MNIKDIVVEPSALYVVATPIGNLQDISLRALAVLRQVNRILVEDTRHANTLLSHYGIAKPLIALHKFNECKQQPKILSCLSQGESLALISDAGTPLISDPGFNLVRALHAENFTIRTVPGPCAAIAALAIAGLPSDKFVFEGFLPAKSTARCAHLQSLDHETRTLIFYEAPHRLLACLVDIQQIFGAQRRACVARELTKLYENVYSTTIVQLIDYYTTNSAELRGEVVILVAGADRAHADTSSCTIELDVLLKSLLAEVSLKQTVKLAQALTGLRKHDLYTRALYLVGDMAREE